MGSKKSRPSRQRVSLWQIEEDEEDEEGNISPDVRIVPAIHTRRWQVELHSLRQ
jgi:hypothetical protein